MNDPASVKKVVLVLIAIGGIAHFGATRLEMRIFPPYIPWPHAAVLVSIVFESLGAAGLLLKRTRRPAGWCLFIVTLAVTPANVYMPQQADLFNIPVWVSVARLPFQEALVALILWSTRPIRSRHLGKRVERTRLRDQYQFRCHITQLPNDLAA